jgi:hypothetical protein
MISVDVKLAASLAEDRPELMAKLTFSRVEIVL